MHTFKHLSDLDPKNHQSSLWYDGPVIVIERGNHRAILKAEGGVSARFDPAFAQNFATYKKEDQTRNATVKNILRKQARNDLELKAMLDGRHYGLNIDLTASNAWCVDIIDIRTSNVIRHKRLIEDNLDAATSVCLDILDGVCAQKQTDHQDGNDADQVRDIIADIVLSFDPPPSPELVSRMRDMMLSTDEPRYTILDYIDAVVYARNEVSEEKLLALDEEMFAVALIWLATDKRETYEDIPHTQEPLEVDIYK